MPPLANTCDVSVVVPTRNRSALLRPALDSLLAQSADGIRYEILVVDNNSTDDTAQTIASYAKAGNIHYLFEPRPGPSHARNRGIAESSAPIVAFADDDVRVSESWVSRLKSIFDRHPDVDCVGGRVLPEWPYEPPSWVTKSHWGPLALADYGPNPFRIDSAHPLCFLTANMAIRRSALASIGGFDPQYLRCQDHELQIRLWQGGYGCLYDPELIVASPVDADRLTKTYVRDWYRRAATFHATMPVRSLFDLPDEVPLILNVPRFQYRRLIEETALWILDSLRRESTSAFLHETRVHYIVKYMIERWRLIWKTGSARERDRAARSSDQFTDRERDSCPT
jgi:glucosyl-dolichyl phosphate glucuronosyltransferase